MTTKKLQEGRWWFFLICKITVCKLRKYRNKQYGQHGILLLESKKIKKKDYSISAEHGEHMSRNNLEWNIPEGKAIDKK